MRQTPHPCAIFASTSNRSATSASPRLITAMANVERGSV
jgi:hypothetical protein